jgi:hypothetical protein
VGRKIHNEEVIDLYSSPNIFRVIKSGKNKLGRACSTYGEGKGYTGSWWGKLRERDQPEDPDVDGRVILKWIFKKGDVGA